MARYELRVKPSVAKDLRGVPRVDVRRILARIEALCDDPRPPGNDPDQDDTDDDRDSARACEGWGGAGPFSRQLGAGP